VGAQVDNALTFRKKLYILNLYINIILNIIIKESLCLFKYCNIYIFFFLFIFCLWMFYKIL